jgi:putative radical SAM enzyme (TIGR03279 family)
MHKAAENKIASVELDSPAHRAGLKPGDEITAVNDHPITDELDLRFHADDKIVRLTIKRRGHTGEKILERGDEDEDLGIELNPISVKTCKNRCMFCFVNQLPKGLRKTLYVKDEDLRLSFLYGSFMTLSNLTEADRKRIVQQHLSPLYVSVHTTNDAVRQKLLGNPAAGGILKEIRFFTGHRIKLHTQIVLCPGYNDGEELENTIKNLSAFHPYVPSIAVVPVGLTSYNNNKIRPLTKEDAADALAVILKQQARLLKKYGEHVVYAADELYLKAGAKFPPLKDYGELPQFENGVGMVPSFLHRARSFRGFVRTPTSPVVTFTGTSFYPYLEKLAARLNTTYGTRLRVIPVENNFFGKSVTVTGLLTGRDIISTLMDKVKPQDTLIIPDVVLKDGNEKLLDDISTAFIAEALNVKTVTAASTFGGLIKAMEAME